VKRLLAVLIAVVALLAVWLSGIGRRSAPSGIASQSVVASNHEHDEAVDAPVSATKGAALERSSLGAPVSTTTTSAVSPARVTIRSSMSRAQPGTSLRAGVAQRTRQFDLATKC
jgi:hypothetical protein